MNIETLYEKFPRVMLGGKVLVWDLRQDILDVSPACRRVYVKSYLDHETRQKLLAIPAAEYIVEGLPEMALAIDCAEAEGAPSSKLSVVAVTGTNGKSTTVSMLGQLFSRATNDPVLVLGTLGLQLFKGGICIETFDTGFTTPDAPALQRLFSNCAKQGWRYLLMEASSQGWSLGRLAGTDFSALGFTNLTQDHLDFHGSMQAYSEAKQGLFLHNLKGLGVLHSASTKVGRNFIQSVRIQGNQRLSEVDHLADFARCESTLEGHKFEFCGTRYHLPLVGKHNLENLRVAFELYQSQFGAYPIAEHVASLTSAKGRLELAGGGVRPYIYVDYAHTPDALEKSLLALGSLKSPDQKLWVIFGCGGDRDHTKRPLMAAIAERLADEVVITSDNPRTENPEAILKQIEQGFTRAHCLSEVDRRLAIRWSLTNMQPHDVLLIAGKGHEEYQIIGNQKVPFSDFEEVAAFTRVKRRLGS